MHELTEPDVASHLRVRFSGARLPPGLAGMLHRHTDGNPLFLVAVIDHMLSRGWILDTSPGWALLPSRTRSSWVCRTTSGAPSRAQFDGLRPADQSLLRAASVAGTEFAPQAIAAALGWTLDDVEARCEILAHAQRFLRDAGVSAWPNDAVVRRYAFTHQLYRQAVYEGTSIGTRQRLHQKIGEALEAAHGERTAEIAGELADHFQRGRDRLRALSYLAAAASGALQRFAHREAGGYLETALALAKQLPDEGERRRRELDLRIALAPILNNTYGFASEELLQNCERALELCSEIGSPAQLFQVVYVLCHVRSSQRSVLAPAMAERLTTLRGASGLSSTVCSRTACWRATPYTTGVSPTRAASQNVSYRLGRHRAPHASCSRTAQDPVVATQTHYSLALWFLGQTDDAMTAIRAGLAAGRSSGSVFTMAAPVPLERPRSSLPQGGPGPRPRRRGVRALHGAWPRLLERDGHGLERMRSRAARAGTAAIEDLERALAAYQTISVRLFCPPIFCRCWPTLVCASAKLLRARSGRRRLAGRGDHARPLLVFRYGVSKASCC